MIDRQLQPCLCTDLDGGGGGRGVEDKNESQLC